MSADMPNLLTLYGAVIAAMLGAVAGSFGATAAVRLAAGQSPWTGRSHCDGCKETLNWLQTVPFVGYVLAKGECGTCHKAIDRFHLAGEGLGAAICVVAWLLAPDLRGMCLGVIGLCLLTQSLIDWRTLRLPDMGNILVAALCGALAFMDRHVIEA